METMKHTSRMQAKEMQAKGGNKSGIKALLAAKVRIEARRTTIRMEAMEQTIRMEAMGKIGAGNRRQQSGSGRLR